MWYEHEIPRPEDRAIRSYLWVRLLHDSPISDIAFDPDQRAMTLTMECSLEIDKKWENLKGDREARLAWIDAHRDEFTYHLTFLGVRYFHAEQLPYGGDYLYGIFLDSALRRKLEAESGKALYHLRVEREDGYLDVVFSRFKVRKAAGRVRYADYGSGGQPEDAREDDLKIARTGDDMERSEAMQRLWQAGHPELLEIARTNIGFREAYAETCEYAAYLLGKLGDQSDLPALFDLYLNTQDLLGTKSVSWWDTLLPKRVILDAIEWIRFRNAPAPTP